jgi:hypothetical protein
MHAFLLVPIVTWYHIFWSSRNVFLLWNGSVTQGMKYHREDHNAIERGGDGDER